MPGCCRVGLRGVDPLPTAYTLNLEDFHEPGDLVTADIDAGTFRGFPELPRSIHGVVRLPEFKELRRYLCIPNLPSRRCPAVRSVIRGRGHLQHTADALDPEPTSSNYIVFVPVD